MTNIRHKNKPWTEGDIQTVDRLRKRKNPVLTAQGIGDLMGRSRHSVKRIIYKLREQENADKNNSRR